VTAAWIVDRLASLAPLRDTIDRAQAIDTVWLLMEPALFERPVADRAWTAPRYRAWFADSALCLLVGPSTSDPGGSHGCPRLTSAPKPRLRVRLAEYP
jgi:hypothetical protein